MTTFHINKTHDLADLMSTNYDGWAYTGSTIRKELNGRKFGEILAYNQRAFGNNSVDLEIKIQDSVAEVYVSIWFLDSNSIEEGRLKFHSVESLLAFIDGKGSHKDNLWHQMLDSSREYGSFIEPRV